MPSTEVLNTSDQNRISIRLRIRLFIVNDLPTILVLFVWFAVQIGLFTMRFFEYHTGLKYFYLRVLITDGVSTARASALCLNLNCLLILLPVCRNLLSFIRYLFPKCSARSYFHRLTIRLFDQHIEFHRCVGYAICFWTLVHAGAHIYNYERLIDVHNEQDSLVNALNSLYYVAPESQINPFGRIERNTLGVGGMLLTIAGSTGLVICICLLLMVSSSTTLIRRSYYEIFWYIHHLFVIFFIGLALHGLQGIVKSQTNVDEHNPNACASRYHDWAKREPCTIYPRFAGAKPGSWMWICGPFAIYILERLIRFIRGLQKVDLAGVIRHESNVIELRFQKKAMAKPQPGQYIYVKCFSISKFEWHPFTVTSAAEEDFVSVHIRTVGNWTKELAQQLAKYPENIPRLGIDGPYGSPADDVFNYDGVILVGAGIGVTPYAAILKHIRSSQASNLQLRRVYFYWICNTTSCYEWFGQMLQEIERELRSRKNFLTYNIYLTQWSMSQARAVVKNNADQRDIWTGLEAKTLYGRPNFEADFQAIINEDWNITKRRDIGVFVCGPKPLTKQLQQLCIKMNDSNRSQNQAHFYLNKENF